MKRTFTFIVMVLSVLLLGCSQKTITTSNKPQANARPTSTVVTKQTAGDRVQFINGVKELIATHPDKSCQQKMSELLKTGKLFIEPNPTVGSLMTTAIKVDNPPELMIRLVINPSFLTTSHLPEQYQKIGRYSEIYHEFIHVSNHFNGKFPLDANVTSWSQEKQAEYYWLSEQDAHIKTWQFLKSNNASIVLMKDQADITTKGEKSAVLDVLFNSMQQTYPSNMVNSFLPTWRELCEKAKNDARVKV